MKLDYYGLNEQPFGEIPDTRFLFVSSPNGQALGSVLVALQKGSSAVSLIGRAGLGKTTLLYHMFNTFKDNVTTVYLFQAPQTPIDLLRSILADLGIREMNEIPQEMLSLLVALLAEHTQNQKRVVVVIDEAQNLTPSVLDVLWMLSNPESRHGRLLQFVLSGQSHVEEPVMPEGNAELSHRSPIVARLEPLSHEDTALYMDHRLRVAGYRDDSPLFTPEASALIARYSEGVPRKINNLCYTSLSLGFEEKRARIEADIVAEVVSDLGLDRERQRVIAPVSESANGKGTDAVVFTPWYERTASTPKQRPAAAGAVAKTRFPARTVEPGKRETKDKQPAAFFAAKELPPPEVVAPPPAQQKSGSAFSGILPKLGLAAAVLLTAAATLVNVRRHVHPPVNLAPAKIVAAPSPAPPAVTPSKPATSTMIANFPKPAPPAPPAPEAVFPRHATAKLTPLPAIPDLKGMDVNAAVRALSGRSLNDICNANFGQCDSKQLEEMRKVNQHLAKSSLANAKRGNGSRKARNASASQGTEAPAAATQENKAPAPPTQEDKAPASDQPIIP